MIGARIAQRHLRISVALAIVVPIAFVFFVVATLRSAPPSSGGIGVADYSAPAVAEDRAAPEFTMPTLAGGRTVSLADFRGHLVVLTFWASWCSPCRREAPFLRAAWTRYSARDVRFLGVDHRDDRSGALAFADTQGLPFPSLFDPEGRLAGQYALFGLPTTFVVGANGRIAYRITGRVDSTNLRSALDRLLRSSRTTP